MTAKTEIALAIVGSPTTAIAAELVADLGIYPEVLAISRRGAGTMLPVAMNGDDWGKRLKHPPLLGAGRLMRGFIDEITRLTGGRPFDCLIHHSKDPFSQLLSRHPSCRKYYYIEEGFTALTGGTFGRPKKRPFQKLVWGLRSHVFYQGRINRYHDFFDTSDPKFGGVYALSKGGFRNFPGRVQLDCGRVAGTVPLPAPVVIFLDSQYFLGNCTERDYVDALCGCLRVLLDAPTSVAMKFHPAESDTARKQRIIEAVASVEGIKSLVELSPTFVGERMKPSDNAKVVVGTSAIGLYLGERGFRTFTFAPRVAPTSAKYAKIIEEIPQEFLKICQGA